MNADVNNRGFNPDDYQQAARLGGLKMKCNHDNYHRACGNEEHDPQNGKIAGYCVVCQTPWPCEFATTKVMTERDQFKAQLEAKQAINTNYRLFDLVRYMRADLHKQNLITDEEYEWLCSCEMAKSPEGGSPSPRRLEDYDQLRAEIEQLKKHFNREAWVVLQDELDRTRKDTELLNFINQLTDYSHFIIPRGHDVRKEVEWIKRPTQLQDDTTETYQAFTKKS